MYQLNYKQLATDRMFDICKSSTSAINAVERMRNTPYAAILEEKTRDVATSASTPASIRVVALAMNNALRQNISVQDAWKQIQKSSQLDEVRKMSFEEYISVIQQSSTVKVNNHIAELADQKTRQHVDDILHEMDNRWLGIHTVCIVLLENIMYRMQPIVDKDEKQMPRGTGLNYRILRNKIKALYKQSIQKTDDYGLDALKKVYHIAIEEWKETDFSAIQQLESIVVRELSKRLDVIRKSLLIACQKQRMEHAEMYAYTYVVSRIAYKIMEIDDEIVREEKMLFRQVNMKTEAKHGLFFREWRSIWECSRDLRNIVAGKVSEITGDFADLAEERIVELLKEITDVNARLYTRRADMAYMTSYSDTVIAVLAQRFRKKVPIPYSWLKEMRERCGRELFRGLVSELRDRKKVMKSLPLDDVEDGRDFVTDKIGKYQLQRAYYNEQRQVETDISIPDKDDPKTRPYYHILMFRLHLLSGTNEEPETVKSDAETLKDKNWQWLWKHHGDRLPDSYLVDMYSRLRSMRAMMRMLKDIGTLATKTRVYLKKMHLKDLEKICNEHFIDRYRAAGFSIPKGAEQLFIDSLISRSRM